MSLDNLKTTLNAIKYLLTDYPKKKDIPTKLPNPNPLTFTGAVTGIYDGSEALTVEIPSGGGGSSVPTAGGVTTLHINVTAVNLDAMIVTKSTADKTPEEMKQASLNGPIWCVVTFAAGTLSGKSISISIPPAYSGSSVAFGMLVAGNHEEDGTNMVIYAVTPGGDITPWSINLMAFG